MLQLLNADPNFVPQEDPSLAYDALIASAVNASLFAEPQGNPELELFLRSLLYTDHDSGDFNDALVLVLTEIFHSCYMYSSSANQHDIERYMHSCRYTINNIMCGMACNIVKLSLIPLILVIKHASLKLV